MFYMSTLTSSKKSFLNWNPQVKGEYSYVLMLAKGHFGNDSFLVRVGILEHTLCVNGLAVFMR